MRKILWGGVAVLAIVLLAPSLLPMLESAVTTGTASFTTFILDVGPKIALGSGALALVLFCFHWTRTHARKMLVGSIICMVGMGAITTVAAWFSTESGHVAPTAANIGSSIITRILNGLSSIG